MRKIQQVTWVLITALSIFMTSCGPNNDKGSTDQESSGKEGAIDSTKIPNFDSSHASLSVPTSLSNYNKAKNHFLIKNKAEILSVEDVKFDSYFTN